MVLKCAHEEVNKIKPQATTTPSASSKLFSYKSPSVSSKNKNILNKSYSNSTLSIKNKFQKATFGSTKRSLGVQLCPSNSKPNQSDEIPVSMRSNPKKLTKAAKSPNERSLKLLKPYTQSDLSNLTRLGTQFTFNFPLKIESANSKKPLENTTILSLIKKNAKSKAGNLKCAARTQINLNSLTCQSELNAEEYYSEDVRFKLDKINKKLSSERSGVVYERLLNEYNQKTKADECYSSIERNYKTQPKFDIQARTNNSPLNLNKIKKTNQDLIRKSLNNFEISFKEMVKDKHSRSTVGYDTVDTINQIEPMYKSK